jgi:hypothetical protein
MTEAQWAACQQPEAMLRFLGTTISDRKLRLWACAFARLDWDFLDAHDDYGWSSGALRTGVEVAERFADGLANRVELTQAAADAQVAYDNGMARPFSSQDCPRLLFRDWALLATGPPSLHTVASEAARRLGSAQRDWEDLTRARAEQAAQTAAGQQAGGLVVAGPSSFERIGERLEELLKHGRVQQGLAAGVLREVVGNPFRPVILATAWLTPTVRTLAQALYGERRFQDLGILADALEEVGCRSPDLMGHLRSGGAHVLGCWALDAVLGKS